MVDLNPLLSFYTVDRYGSNNLSRTATSYDYIGYRNNYATVIMLQLRSESE